MVVGGGRGGEAERGSIGGLLCGCVEMCECGYG